MKYTGRADGKDAELAVEREGLRLGPRLVDYADVASLRPINHRVFVDLLDGRTVEISMLGFSYDGFWDELTESFGKRSLEALFAEEPPLMRCEGEYAIPGESGRGRIALLPDAVCVLPQTRRALRIPLCFTREIRRDGYLLHFLLRSGASCTVGRMGYDTEPFAERAAQAADRVKKQRSAALAKTPVNGPFTEKGLFRTAQPEQYWNAAYGAGVCALELFTGEDAATYLYRFDEPRERFSWMLEEAMEAVGVHRELIFLSEEKLAEKPLYRMAAARSEAVCFLRARSAGRLIHSAGHAERLLAFLNG